MAFSQRGGGWGVEGGAKRYTRAEVESARRQADLSSGILYGARVAFTVCDGTHARKEKKRRSVARSRASLIRWCSAQDVGRS